MRGAFYLFALSLGFFVGQAPMAQGGIKIRGELLEKGTRKPLAGANVFILPHKLKGTSDPNGNFEIPDVPAGPATWIINHAGYLKFEKADEFSESAEPTEYTIYLERSTYRVYETVIVDKNKRKDDATKTLTAAEFATLPGSGGDAVKAVQNLPGVNRTSAFQSQIIVQGSEPQDTKYFIDAHEVPLIFHFGGISSVVSPESLERVDYLSAGYGAEHGRAMGGLVGVWTRKPETDRIHGMGFLDVFNAGGYVQGPSGKASSFFFGVRRSYVGTVMRALLKDNEDFDLTVAPSFSDLTGIYDTELTPRDSFRLVTVGSIDTLEFLLKEPVKTDPAFRGRFYSKTAFFRIIPELTHRHSERTISRWSLGLGRDFIRFDNSDNYFSLRTHTLTARGEVERKFTPDWTSTLGFDHRLTWAEVALQFPAMYSAGGVVNPFSSGETQRASANNSTHLYGGYWSNVIQPAETPWTFIPAARLDHYQQTEEWLPAPRAAVTYQWDPSLKLKTAGGLYYQPPQEWESSDQVGNPGIQAPRAWHATLGAEKDFRDGSTSGWTLTGAGFYRYFDRLVVESSRFMTLNGQVVPERFNNDGRGRAFGLESQAKYEFGRWAGWLSYTLLKSSRWTEGYSPHPSPYDQTHNLTAIAAVELPRNWKISARARYVTGNPTTPVLGGIFDADNDVYVPVRGPIYSERLGSFFQADLRFDKKWIFRTWILTAYLDIQNVSNQKNSESIQYNYNYTRKDTVKGLPLLPTFGLKGEF